MNIICFHNPNEENGYLSNWYPSPFKVGNVEFSSREQFMMYRKALCFCDEVIAKKILSTDDVAEIKSLGREVSNYDEHVWNGVRQIVVYEGPSGKILAESGFERTAQRYRRRSIGRVCGEGSGLGYGIINERPGSLRYVEVERAKFAGVYTDDGARMRVVWLFLGTA